MPELEHSAGGVIFEDGKVLLILSRNLRGENVWTFPKGHLEPGETHETAARREVAEETGWDCVITAPLCVAEYSFTRAGVLVNKDVRWFLVKRVGGDGRPGTPNEVFGMKWLPLAEAEKELVYKSDLDIAALLGKLPHTPPAATLPEPSGAAADMSRGEMCARFRRDFALNAEEAALAASSRELAEYTEACLREAARLGLGAKPVITLIAGEFLALLKARRIPLAELAAKAIAPAALAGTAALVSSGRLSASAAKTVFAGAWDTGRAPEALLEELGLAQVSDPALLEAWAREAIAERPQAAAALRLGREKAIGPLVGLLLKKSGGKANPRLAGEMIRKLLS